MRSWLARIPWHASGLGPLVALVAMVGLIEFTRSGLYTAYLPQARGGALGLGMVGLAATVQYLADTLSRSPGGLWADRLGPGRLLPVAAALSAVSALGILWAPSAAWLLLASFANGLAVAPAWPTLMTYSTRAARDDEDGRAVGLTFMLVAPFIGAGVLLTGFVYERSPASAATLLAATQLLLVFVAFVFVRRQLPRRPRATLGYGPGFPWREVLGLAPGALAQMFAFGVLAPVIFPFLNRLGFSTGELVLALAVGGGLELLLISPVGRLVDRSRPLTALTAGLFLAAAALVAFAHVRDLRELLVVSAAVGALQALLIPAWGSLVSRSLPDDHKAGAWGAVMTLEGLGFALGPVMGGFTWEWWGAQAPFYLGAAFYALVALFYLVRRRV